MSHDPANTPNPQFPKLTPSNHRITSPADPIYNCIAWAAGDAARWWEPTEYWPDPEGRAGYELAGLVRVYRSLGFEPCDDDVLEPGFTKVALYASGTNYTHAARQLPDGRWTSKLGKWEDIEHDTPDDVAGGAYGTLAQFMRRPTQTE